MDNKAIALSFENGGQLTVVEGDSYIVRPLELKGLDINSFMNTLRHALPTAFKAENSNGVIRIEGPRDFQCSFKVQENRGSLTGISDTNGVLFQYPIGRINAINLLKRIFQNAWVDPSEQMVHQALSDKISNLASVSQQKVRKRHAIFGDKNEPSYIITLRYDDSASPQPYYTDRMYKVTIKNGNFSFVGEYSYDEEYYGDSTTTIEQMQIELDALQERIRQSKEIKALVESCNMSFAFSLSPNELTNK